jgi:hypothetical protein
MTKRKAVVLMFVVPSLSLVVSLHAEQWVATNVAIPKQPTLVRQVVGGGRWQSASATGDRRGWGVEVKHFDDNSFTGRVTLVGAPVPHAGIEGQISGNEAYGVLVDDNGMQIGTFTGSISNGGISGRYTAANGDTGSWSWDGPLPGVQTAPGRPPIDQNASADPITESIGGSQ